MTMLVCMPLEEEYVQIGEAVLEALEDPRSPSQSAQVVRAGELLVESMLQVMIVDLIEEVEMKGFAKKLIMQLESIMLKTSNALINKVISKLSNKELKPLIDYLQTMEVEMEGNTYLSFPLDAQAETDLYASFDALDEGNLSVARAKTASAVSSIMDQALLVLYKKPMSLIKLGLVARKIVDLGYVTIHKTAKPIITKVVSSMELDELASLKRYFTTLLAEVD